MILYPYAGDTRGGSVNSSFLLIEELQSRGRRLLLAFHGDGFARDLARRRCLPAIDLPALGPQSESSRKDGFRLGNLTAAPGCRRAIRRHGVSLVHVNDKRMLRTWCIPTKTAGRLLLAHWRSVYRPSWSVDLGLRLAERVICVSAYSHDLLPPWAQAKSEVIYNPFQAVVDRDGLIEARCRIRQTAGIPMDAAVIGFFGTLIDRKRPHVLLKILQRLKMTADRRPVYGLVCGEAQEPRDDLFFHIIKAQSWDGRLISAGHVDNVGD